MNDLFEQEIHYKILKLLSVQPNLSQRTLASRLSISLGKTNYVLSELAEKGIIKMKRFKNAPQKIPYSYILTPRGLEQKAKITARFLKQKLTEYEQIKTQIKEITQELKNTHDNSSEPYADVLNKTAKM
jgi:EPS-associated MarR family transcriptional regulator